MTTDVVIENLRLPDGQPGSIAVRGGRICRSGGFEGMRRINAQGATLGPGFEDHHIHIAAEVSARQSLDLSGVAADTPTFAEKIADAPQVTRIIGAEGAEGLTRAHLDEIAPDRPLRVQARTGGLWVLNSAALALLPSLPDPLPEAFLRDASGRLNGQVQRGDRWLRQAPLSPALLHSLGRELAARGVTALTDASETNGPGEGRLLALAALPQRLSVMSGHPHWPEDAPCLPRWLKLVPDEWDLPDFDSTLSRIEAARQAGIATAIHAVTASELAFAMALFLTAGVQPGDRIEHAIVVPPEAIATLAALSAEGLVVVVNPGFLRNRADRWLREVAPEDLPHLLPLRRMLEAGVSLRAGSDAPYGPSDPAIGVQAACDRRSLAGAVVGAAEALPPEAARALYSCWPGCCDGLQEGAVADFILSRRGTMQNDPQVTLTVSRGEIIHSLTAGEEPAPGLLGRRAGNGQD